MWEDKSTYWAWRGELENMTELPSIKELSYADVPIGNGRTMQVCNGVTENGVFKPLNQKEIESLQRFSEQPLDNPGNP